MVSNRMLMCRGMLERPWVHVDLCAWIGRLLIHHDLCAQSSNVSVFPSLVDALQSARCAARRRRAFFPTVRAIRRPQVHVTPRVSFSALVVNISSRPDGGFRDPIESCATVLAALEESSKHSSVRPAPESAPLWWSGAGGELVRHFRATSSLTSPLTFVLCPFVAGISSNSEDHRPHSTRSGKQRKIMRY